MISSHGVFPDHPPSTPLAAARWGGETHGRTISWGDRRGNKIMRCSFQWQLVLGDKPSFLEMWCSDRISALRYAKSTYRINGLLSGDKGSKIKGVTIEHKQDKQYCLDIRHQRKSTALKRDLLLRYMKACMSSCNYWGQEVKHLPGHKFRKAFLPGFLCKDINHFSPVLIGWCAKICKNLPSLVVLCPQALLL